MRKYLSLIFVLIFTTPLFGQSDTAYVSFVAYWSIGDSYNFKVSKIQQQWNEGVQTKDEQQSYIANFTVIDSTEESYTIIWSFENDLGNTYNIPEKLLDKFSKYKLTEIKYKTSELGDFQEIINWKEVGNIMNNMFDDIVETIGEDDKKKQDALRKALQPLKEVYSSKQGIEQIIMKELQYLHFPMGMEYDINETITYEDELPNMFGGDPIKADAKLYFENVDFDSGFCTLKHEVNLDQSGTKEMIKQLFRQMKLDDKEMKRDLKSAVFIIEDRNTFEYYYNPGIPHRIEIIRETLIDISKEKRKRIDKTIIELIYDE